MKLQGKILAPLALLAAAPKLAGAHCPLCIGAVGGAVAAATVFGFNPAVVGVFVGALGVVSGQWTANLLKKQYLPLQTALLIVGSFILMLLPAVAASPVEMYAPLFLFGEAGSLFNKVYWINSIIPGAIAGGLAALVGHYLHIYIKEKRGAVLFPFQGIATTIGMTLIAAGIAQALIH